MLACMHLSGTSPLHNLLAWLVLSLGALGAWFLSRNQTKQHENHAPAHVRASKRANHAPARIRGVRIRGVRIRERGQSKTSKTTAASVVLWFAFMVRQPSKQENSHHQSGLFARLLVCLFVPSIALLLPLLLGCLIVCLLVLFLRVFSLFCCLFVCVRLLYLFVCLFCLFACWAHS